MSSSLFAYKYSKGEWFVADDLHESDVVVIIDTSRESIWFFSGKHSTARNRSNARELLSDLIKQYTSYVIKIVSGDSPDDILVKIEDLKEKYFKRKLANLNYDLRKISQAFFYLNLIACLALMIAITFSVLLFTGSNYIMFENYYHYSMAVETFSSQILFITSLFFVSFIIFSTLTLMAIFTNTRLLILLGIIISISTFFGFFIVYIRDMLIFSEVIGGRIYIRMDIFFLFILNINIFGSIALIVGFYLLIVGQKKILRVY